MKTALFATEKICNHTKNFGKKLTEIVLNEIQIKLDKVGSIDECKRLLEEAKISVDSAFSQQEPIINEPMEVKFGQKNKCYLIDLKKTLKDISNIPELRDWLKKDGFIIKLALYHDELTLVNPIGIFKDKDLLLRNLLISILTQS